jgi:hypothetical protein
VAAHQLGLYSATIVVHTRHAISFDLAGSLPQAVAVASSAAQALAVLLVLWFYARGPDNPRRLTVAFAAAVGASALVLAQVWFFHYRDVFTLGGYGWLVLVRDLLLVALFVGALLALRRRATEDEDSVLLEDEAPVRVPS